MSFSTESCSVEELCVELGGSVNLLLELRDKLRDWLKLQPHLPQDAPTEKLEWIILNCKMSLERAKQKLDMYYTVRRHVPELFTNRDPHSPSITTVQSAIQFVVLPKLTPQKGRTVIFRVTDTDSSKLQPWEIAKYMIMVCDIRMGKELSFCDHLVGDLEMVRLNHIMKLTPTLVKKFEVVVLKAYGSRIKGIHLINAPPFVDRIVTLLKSVLKPKLASRIHVYRPGKLESFYQFVPKSVLPKEYGGDESTMKELSGMLYDDIKGYRDWFLEQEKILVNENLRPGPTFDADSLFGFSGSFRKLDID